MTLNNKCARTACPAPHDNCEHTQTGKKYCARCAGKINEHNPGLVALHALTETESTETAAAVLGGLLLIVFNH